MPLLVWASCYPPTLFNCLSFVCVNPCGCACVCSFLLDGCCSCWYRSLLADWSGVDWLHVCAVLLLVTCSCWRGVRCRWRDPAAVTCRGCLLLVRCLAVQFRCVWSWRRWGRAPGTGGCWVYGLNGPDYTVLYIYSRLMVEAARRGGSAGRSRPGRMLGVPNAAC